MPRSVSRMIFTVAIAAGLPWLMGADDPRVRFRESRFGLSTISWGVWGILGKGEAVMETDSLPVREYEKLLSQFKGGGFQADEWVNLAKAAGAKYLVVNAKGPDGFCMFDSKTTDYDVVDATPFGKDPIRMLADACRKQGIGLGVSYSLRDWHHPDSYPIGRTGSAAGRSSRGNWSKYVETCQAQIKELCQNYGDLVGVWLEGLDDRPEADWKLPELVASIRKLQPQALTVRAQAGTSSSDPTDLHVIRRADPSPGATFEVVEDFPTQRDQEPSATATILSALLRSVARGGNFRLVLEPRADGLLLGEQVERLKEVGNWLEKHGQAVYGAKPGPIPPRPWGVTTRSGTGESVFLIVLDPTVPLRIPSEPLAFEAKTLNGANSLNAIPDADGIRLELPENFRTSPYTVVVIRPKSKGN